MIVNAWDGTMGAKAALQNAGYSAGDVKLVGFDGLTPSWRWTRAGFMLIPLRCLKA